MFNFSNMEDNEMDNPFRPGSELSREADIIVNLIKEGKPITPTREMENSAEAINGGGISKKSAAQSSTSPKSNGTKKAEPGEVEVQHGIIVPPNDTLQTVEQVNLKKKSKCCSIV